MENSKLTSNTQSNLAQRLARPELLELQVYQSARRIGGQGDIWINANESPFNNSEIDNLNRYPECQPPELINAYSQYSGVAKECIISSRGADEAIELLIRTFCIAATDSIATFGPTYGMYAISAKTFNVGVKALLLTEDFQLPSDYLSQVADAKLIFICNPNNPTGSVIPRERIVEVINRCRDAIVVVDEAYIEFSPEYSVADLVASTNNLVVLRTLSKAFALAGARCGFLLANPDIIEMCMRVIAPYPVPLPVSEVAVNALSQQGLLTMGKQVADMKSQGARLADALRQYGAKVVTPYGNYVLAEFDDVATVQQKLTAAGVIARAYSDPRLSQAIRFSFTNKAQTDYLIDLLS
ncbi:histidinol-phosphate transaminase [Shewanella fidelis]|uniref:Histidinol-phosphate aminotransferase n=1 Tax=Shewanella fidelis TaxID=173509 RepID=A0AAW8NML1_9GAMM|nr:histidinol-phosphate transaminase [Shewanella fidelis]MDR8524122.1 histidinol-phosphate transaminase [Shewanella fidelis]MDW4810669.1 histidinol-phosphate transaminase [Shewanella fidelis]MDW4814790.1 histidinol-phosphate transaminase [Shewanella fidelis]MDW4818880.1 histidinol-phosphate transaminase [Shewanella fidelis]MDW4823443.1 histidinol-phosphate transaminase [Shewanella fidelis]